MPSEGEDSVAVHTMQLCMDLTAIKQYLCRREPNKKIAAQIAKNINEILEAAIVHDGSERYLEWSTAIDHHKTGKHAVEIDEEAIFSLAWSSAQAAVCIDRNVKKHQITKDAAYWTKQAAKGLHAKRSIAGITLKTLDRSRGGMHHDFYALLPGQAFGGSSLIDPILEFNILKNKPPLWEMLKLIERRRDCKYTPEVNTEVLLRDIARYSQEKPKNPHIAPILDAVNSLGSLASKEITLGYSVEEVDENGNTILRRLRGEECLAARLSPAYIQKPLDLMNERAQDKSTGWQIITNHVAEWAEIRKKMEANFFQVHLYDRSYNTSKVITEVSPPHNPIALFSGRAR
jgi:hypothetical protein